MDEPAATPPERDDEQVELDREPDHSGDRATAPDRYAGALRAGGELRDAVKRLRDEWT